jgi:AGCS family alanine or glycine:cation symporter
MITELLDKIDSIMYYPILIIVMSLAGLYFTALTGGVQIRLFPESLRLLKEPPEDKRMYPHFRLCWSQRHHV